MKARLPVTRMPVSKEPARRFLVPLIGSALVAIALAGCSSGPSALGSKGSSAAVDPKLGVAASPRMVAMGDKVPKGGGRAMVGKPYKVAGKRYVPRLDPDYSKVGLASWYGNAFHGRKTANGEIFASEALSAAHPTMPLPSYARVTSLQTGRSVIVRVNDRGPFHSNRLIDISRRTADVLGVRSAGIAKVQVEYVGPAPVHGHDEEFLVASYRGPGEVRPSLPETLIASAEALPGVAARATADVAGAAVDLVTRPVAAVAGTAVADEAEEAPPVGPRIPGDVLPPVRPLLAGEAYVMVASVDPADVFSGDTQVASLDLPVVPVGYTPPSATAADAIGDLILPPEPPVRRSYAADRVDAAYAAWDGLEEGVALSDLAARLADRAARPAPGPVLQAGLFADRRNAETLAAALSPIGTVSVDDLVVGGRTLVRVRVSALAVGPDAAVAAAERAGARGAVVVAR